MISSKSFGSRKMLHLEKVYRWQVILVLKFFSNMQISRAADV